MNDRSGLRLVIIGVLVFSLPITLLGRLWYMQALAAPQYIAAVNANATSVIRTLALSDAVGVALWNAADASSRSTPAGELTGGL